MDVVSIDQHKVNRKYSEGFMRVSYTFGGSWSIFSQLRLHSKLQPNI